jgi:hypothetical protein
VVTNTRATTTEIDSQDQRLHHLFRLIWIFDYVRKCWKIRTRGFRVKKDENS